VGESPGAKIIRIGSGCCWSHKECYQIERYIEAVLEKGVLKRCEPLISAKMSVRFVHGVLKAGAQDGPKIGGKYIDQHVDHTEIEEKFIHQEMSNI
jgi:hypothetical protein